MLVTVGTVVLTVAVLRLMEMWVQVKDSKDRTWKEEDQIPDAVD